MDKEGIKKRLKDAINYLASIGMIDGKSTTKAIAADMGRNNTTIGAARAGDKRYLTQKFIKAFCAQYNNVISPEWIWNGVGTMVAGEPNVVWHHVKMIDFMSLPKEKLVTIINALIDLHNRHYEMISSEQSSLMGLISSIASDVADVRTKKRIDDIFSNPKFFTYLADAISISGNKKMKEALSGATNKEKEKILKAVFREMPDEQVEALFTKVLDKFDSIDVISDDD